MHIAYRHTPLANRTAVANERSERAARKGNKQANRNAARHAIIVIACSSPDPGAGEHLRPADKREPARRGSGER